MVTNSKDNWKMLFVYDNVNHLLHKRREISEVDWPFRRSSSHEPAEGRWQGDAQTDGTGP